MLPRKYTPGAPPIGSLSASAGGDRHSSPEKALSVPDQKAPSPAPSAAHSNAGSQEIVEALYDYNGRDATDLSLQRGARIAVMEKLNGDWWRGRDINSGREGIFPSNYVRGASNDYGDEKKGMYVAPSHSPAPSQQQYYAPPPQMYAAQSAPPYYPPPSTNYYQQPPPEQMAPQAQQEGHQHHAGAAMKKFGSKLGNAAIFGAGATIGSDIVNSIF